MQSELALLVFDLTHVCSMLQLCTFGEGATRHWNSTGQPGNNHGIGMTLREYESHLALWAIIQSPLIQSADLRTVGERHPECLKLMLNQEIIQVNQDVAGFPAQLLYAYTNATGMNYTEVGTASIVAQAFSRRLSLGRIAVVLFKPSSFFAKAWCPRVVSSQLVRLVEGLLQGSL